MFLQNIKNGPGSSVGTVRSGERRVMGLIPGRDITLRTQTYGVELGLVNQCQDNVTVWYHVKCLGHDTSVRQHY